MGRMFGVSKLLLILAAILPNDVVSLDILPDCVLGVENVDYFIYNRNNRDGVIVQKNSNNIPIIPGIITVFLVHGFDSEANTSQYLDLTNTLVDKYEVNVISVDWKKGACSSGGFSLTQILSYPSAVRNTKAVGDDLSKFISRLVSEYKMSLEDINFVGHSLGAHVVGFAGKDLQKRGAGKMHHLLALDPAGPGFETSKCSKRVCSSDAEFVQIFHTSFAFGMHKAIGDIDFYINGGINQPNCPLLNRPICSHSSAIQYLIDIFRDPNCKYVGRKWNRASFFPPSNDCTEKTCSIPGPLAPELPARGTFYVDTKDLPSYCLEDS